MGRSLSPLLRQELANLDKDADSRKSAMKALTSYAKDLDSKAIPTFLAEVSDSNGSPGATSGECTISLYEVLARVHGRNIVPQIGNIMSTIMRMLSSSRGSFALHQACSKVVPAIARYGIDPSTPETEKTRIISSLCKPLSDALMGAHESPASGAALCLKALVESWNWRYAPDEMVNEVCLKVAGALEEKATQTNAHMGLVMALAKHNGLTAEAYARSLVRSGLQILATGASESNSQRRLSAIQMINFLMKCVDPRSISSEVFKIIDVMEKCQAEDKMPFVRGAAFEALQTAKTLTSQRGSRHEIAASPVVNSNSCRRQSKSPWRARDNVGSSGNGTPVQFCSPESQTIDSCFRNEAPSESPASVGQSSCNVENGRRTNRRLWHHDCCPVDISLKDGLLLKACSGNNNNKPFDSEQNDERKPSDMSTERLDAFTGFIQANNTDKAQDKTPSSKRSIQQLTMDDIKIYSTPRKLILSLQGSSYDSSECLKNQNVTVVAHDCNKIEHIDRDDQSQNFNSKNGAISFENASVARKLNNLKDAENVQDGVESVSSTTDIPESSICETPSDTSCEDNNTVMVKSTNRMTYYGSAALGFFFGAAVVLLAIIFLFMIADDNELVFDMVPT